MASSKRQLEQILRQISSNLHDEITPWGNDYDRERLRSLLEIGAAYAQLCTQYPNNFKAVDPQENMYIGILRDDMLNSHAGIAPSSPLRIISTLHLNMNTQIHEEDQGYAQMGTLYDDTLTFFEENKEAKTDREGIYSFEIEYFVETEKRKPCHEKQDTGTTSTTPSYTKKSLTQLISKFIKKEKRKIRSDQLTVNYIPSHITYEDSNVHHGFCIRVNSRDIHDLYQLPGIDNGTIIHFMLRYLNEKNNVVEGIHTSYMRPTQGCLNAGFNINLTQSRLLPLAENVARVMGIRYVGGIPTEEMIYIPAQLEKPITSKPTSSTGNYRRV